jgi:hypothetical protein
MTQTFPTARKPLDRNRVKHCKKPSSDATAEERLTYAKDRRMRKANARAKFVPDQRAINAARHSLIHHDHKPKKVKPWWNRSASPFMLRAFRS